jgi:hypothetical protein
MKLNLSRWGVPIQHRLIVSLAALFLVVPSQNSRGDQVETQNGDRYVGKVLSMSGDMLVLQSELLGTVRLPRAKVAHITLGTNAPIPSTPVTVPTNGNASQTASLAVTNANPDLAAALHQLGSNSNLIRQVEAQFLSGSGPEAKDKFDELMGGLLSGKLTVNDIRAEAKSVADQMRAARKELGEEGGGFMIDSYLAILDNFLKETTPNVAPATNSAVPPAKSRRVLSEQ